MSVWFTSDHHFGHENIIGYTNRPYHGVGEMNADMVARWNACILPDDDVYVLGDFAMGNLDDSLSLVGQLNGTKRLIPGNHDKMFRRNTQAYINAVNKYFDAGFTNVLEGVVQFPEWTLCHFPFRGDGEEYDSRHLDYRPDDAGQLLLHGHTHGMWRKLGRMIDVGVDAWGGYPVSWKEIDDTFNDPTYRLDAKAWIPW